MPDIGGAIRQAALLAVAEAKPIQVVFGTISAKQPYKIRLEQKRELMLDKTFFIPTALLYSEYEIGDKLVLLQMQGGQRYCLLERLVEDASDLQG